MSGAADLRVSLPGASAIDYRAEAASTVSLLEGRIAHLLPKLTRAECAFAVTHVRTGLRAMARERAKLVRSAMEEGVRSIATPTQAEPIDAREAVELLLPALTDADLVHLLATPHSPHSMASHADRLAIQSLLSSGSASVQEAILDALVGKKLDPDNRATALSSQAEQSLWELAATYALETLPQSEDWPTPLRTQIMAQFDRHRLDLEPDETVLANIRGLKASNLLTEPVLLKAAQGGEHRRVAAILAVAGGVPLHAVDHASGLRNAKALTALAWKSGFTMRSAVAAQAVLGQLNPANRLSPNDGGGFPLAKAEMEWQIESMRALRDEGPTDHATGTGTRTRRLPTTAD